LPGRGLLTVACLVAIALGCISVVRKLERERRLLRRLRGESAAGIALDALTEDERDCATSLASAGVVSIERNRCSLKTARLPSF